jgi:serine protease Do
MASFGAGLLVAGLFSLPHRTAAQLATAAHPAAATLPNAAGLSSLSDAFASLAERVKPSVVYIESSHKRSAVDGPQIPHGLAPFFRGLPPGHARPEVERGSGSGFIVSTDGDILTNAHVVDSADRVIVRLLDRREFPARVLGTDPNTDIALLHIDATGLIPAALGNSDEARVGEWVLAVGNPLGENLSFTVTSGIISAKGRTLALPNQTERSIQDFIQTDAAINPGNSGGPLLNVRGEVIGINSAIASETGFYTGYGFAIPINIARQVEDQLAHGGRVRRAMLGIRVKDAGETDARYVGLPDIRGVVVEDLGSPESPARRAGFLEGDVIVAVDGKPIQYVGQVQQVIAFHKPGDDVAVDIARKGGVRRTLHVRVEEAPAELATAAAHPDRNADDNSSSATLAGLGIAVAPGEEDNVHGLVVTAVDQDGPCADRVYPPEDGGPDVIVSIEGRKVRSPSEAQSVIQAAGHGAIVELVVYNPQAHANRVERVRLN